MARWLMPTDPIADILAGPCAACGGRVEMVARAGRLAAYRDAGELPIPADMAIPTCIQCSAEWFKLPLTAQLDAALEVEYRRRAQLVAIRIAAADPIAPTDPPPALSHEERRVPQHHVTPARDPWERALERAGFSVQPGQGEE